MRTIPLTPAPGFCLIEPLNTPEGRLVLVNNQKESPIKGRVLAVGRDYMTEFGVYLISPAKKGDTILHSSVGYETFKHENKEYRAVPFTKILAIYEI